jgi:hypothetical protein
MITIKINADPSHSAMVLNRVQSALMGSSLKVTRADITAEAQAAEAPKPKRKPRKKKTEDA